MKSVLVSVSPEGRCAHLRRAAWLAQRCGARIILLCVAPAPQAQPALEAARRDVANVAPDMSTKLLTDAGDPVHAILRAAASEAVDLVVMGLDRKWHMEKGWSHERAFQRFLRKSTVARVVQEASCPVWLDRPTNRDDMRLPVLFCFLDLTRYCDGLIRFAAGMAGLLETQMALFHCTVSAHIFGPGQSRRAIETQQEIVAMATRRIGRLQARCAISAPCIVTSGDGVSMLGEALLRRGPGLIVIDRASRRWGDNETIYEILRRCPAPVLVHVGPGAGPVSTDQYAANIQTRIWAFLMLLSLAAGLALICLLIYLAVHTDNCHLAPIRCQLPPEFIFQGSPEFED